MCDKDDFEGSYSGKRIKTHFNTELGQVETFITPMTLFIERVGENMYVAKQKNLSNGDLLCMLFSASKDGKILTTTTAGGQDELFWSKCDEALTHIWSIPADSDILVSARTKFYRDHYY